MTFLLRFLPYIAGTVLIFGLGWWLRHSGYQAGEAASEARMAKAVAAAEARAEVKTQKAELRVNDVEKSHAEQIAKLDQRYRNAVGRIGPVRVCNNSASSSEVSAAASAAGSDPNPASGAGLPEPSRDIGPGLVELARDADRQTQRLIACQAYAREIERFRAP